MLVAPPSIQQDSFSSSAIYSMRKNSPPPASINTILPSSSSLIYSHDSFSYLDVHLFSLKEVTLRHLKSYCILSSCPSILTILYPPPASILNIFLSYISAIYSHILTLLLRLIYSNDSVNPPSSIHDSYLLYSVGKMYSCTSSTIYSHDSFSKILHHLHQWGILLLLHWSINICSPPPASINNSFSSSSLHLFARFFFLDLPPSILTILSPPRWLFTRFFLLLLRHLFIMILLSSSAIYSHDSFILRHLFTRFCQLSHYSNNSGTSSTIYSHDSNSSSSTIYKHDSFSSSISIHTILSPSPRHLFKRFLYLSIFRQIHIHLSILKSIYSKHLYRFIDFSLSIYQTAQ
ncbi:unnamed protein product [Acanthosepion pharaonis]|uniref:Uncharacterized protein n=1 Tax=Acanthosepion pharaonis TaxID=158019 RepID=A0A812DF80_ACAPH|nr:unnamed protein product [Sepia pharaonis]